MKGGNDISFNVIKVILFCTVIGLPLLFGVLDISLGQTNFENREKAIKPKLSFSDHHFSSGVPAGLQKVNRDVVVFINRFEDYYNDNFKFRQQLFEWNRAIKQGVFNADLIPDKVISGNDGWLFSGNSNGDVILESLGLKLFTTDQVERIQQRVINKKEILATLGIEFFVLIAPNKHSVYDENLFIDQNNEVTKMDQILGLDALKSFVISPLDSFKRAQNKQLYFKTDTHWNDEGAFLAYSVLTNKMFPNRQSVSNELLDFTKSKKQGDLSRMLGIKYLEEYQSIKYLKSDEVEPLPGALVAPDRFVRNHGLSRVYEKRYRNAGGNLKSIIYHDSFGEALIDFINQDFHESIFIWDNFIDFEVLKNEKPDVVILELVERNLDDLLNL